MQPDSIETSANDATNSATGIVKNMEPVLEDVQNSSSVSICMTFTNKSSGRTANMSAETSLVDVLAVVHETNRTTADAGAPWSRYAPGEHNRQ